MRRSVGIQALECHVLITRVLNDSIRIVNEVRNVCARHKYDLNQRANLFQYRPAATVVTSTANMEKSPQQTKPPVYHKPSPFSKLQKRTTSRGPPQQSGDENRTSGSSGVVYDAFADSSFLANRAAAGGLGSDSRSNFANSPSSRNPPASPSLFSKIKSNLIDKSKLGEKKNENKTEKIKE